MCIFFSSAITCELFGILLPKGVSHVWFIMAFAVQALIIKSPLQTITNVERAAKCEHYCIIEESVKYEEKQQNFQLRKRTGMSVLRACLLYTSPSPRDDNRSRMPSSA